MIEGIRIGNEAAACLGPGDDAANGALHARAQFVERVVDRDFPGMQAQRLGYADVGAARPRRLRNEAVDRVTQSALAIVVADAFQVLGDLFPA